MKKITTIFKSTVVKTALLLTVLFLPLAAVTNDTAAGTVLLSTNTKMSFSNWANVQYTRYGTNNWSQVLAAIYGFTNSYGSNYKGTYTNFPSQEFFAKYSLLNEGNIATVYNLSFRVESITNYDGKLPHDPSVSPWILDTTTTNQASPVSILGSPLATPGVTETRTTNIGEDGAFHFAIRIKSPSNAINGTGYRIFVTNKISTNHGPYKGSNNYVYGGSRIMTNVFEYKVKAPDLRVWKTVSVTNPAYAANKHSATALVPGSRVTYTIHYTNRGDASALGLNFEEYLPNLVATAGTRYVDYVVGSMTGTGVTSVGQGYVFSTSVLISENKGSTFPAALSTKTANSGVVNTTVDALKIGFGATGLEAKKGGTVQYSVIVR